MRCFWRWYLQCWKPVVFSRSFHICSSFASAWGHKVLVNLTRYMRSFLHVFCNVNKENLNQMTQPLKKSFFFPRCTKAVCWVQPKVAFLAPSQSDSEVGSGCSPAFASLGSPWRELADEKLGLTLPGVALLQKNAGEAEMSFLSPGLPVPRDVLVVALASAYSWVQPRPAWPAGMSQGLWEGAGASLQAGMCWEDA